MNLALPILLFTEPQAPLMTKSKEYDEIMLGPVKVVPGEFSCWDKHHINGPMTLGEIVEFYKKAYDVEVTMLSSGKIILYNSYAMQPQVDRLAKNPLQVTFDILEEHYPDWKDTYEIIIGAESAGTDVMMPNLVYHIKKE